MEKILNFWNEYKGAIIGIIIAVLIIITKLYEIVISIVLIFLGAIVGNYIQHNKELVKDRIKYFVDKL